MRYLFVLVLIFSSCCIASAQTKTIYTCPMHPRVQQDKPGKCPICGMTLVKKTIKVSAPKPAPKPAPKRDQPKPQPKVEAPVKRDTVVTPVITDTSDANEHQHDDEEQMFADTIASSVFSPVDLSSGRTIVYHLYVKDTIVNFTGSNERAIAMNGSIPAPTLVFTEGDTAEIYLHNLLDEETSLHWHGVILPNQADGVPFLTTKRIGPGDTHLYKFRVVQNGTYWYHSHSALQEQSGMYGALIFLPRVQTISDAAPSFPVEPVHDHHADSDDHNTLPESEVSADFDKVYTLVLSEWTNDNPMQVQRRLRTANDWFAIKKGSVQSYAEAIKAGHFKTKFINEWKRMKAMDVSDVFYDKFLANGRPQSVAPDFKAGDRVRVQIVNAGASSYFWVQFAGGKLTVVGNDGNDMSPVEVDRLIIAPAETFDVIVTVPDDMMYELRATAEDRTGASSVWFGSGMKMPAPVLPRLRYFEGMKMMNDMMKTNGEMNDMGMNMSNQKMDMNSVMYPEIMDEMDDTIAMEEMDHSAHGNMSSGIVTLNYDMLRSPVKTMLPEGFTRTLHFTLTGNMNRYVWTLDNKTVKEADRIMIKKGENLRLIITNNSMMRHPMHLHGHDFRVVNSHTDYSPLKNVIDIMPMETDTIEFAANQSGNWFFHCHILFHMMAGMGRVFRYENSPVNPELPDHEAAYQKFRKHKDQNMYHLMARIGIESNGTEGEIMVSSNRYALRQHWHLGYNDKHGYETETLLGRYFGVNQWWFGYIGFDYHYQNEHGEDHVNAPIEKNMFGQVSNKSDRKAFVIGVEYMLPWLVFADARIDSDGKFRFQLSREDIPISSRLRLNFMGNTDKEYSAGLRYVVSKWLALSTHYDSDMGVGAGITLTY